MEFRRAKNVDTRVVFPIQKTDGSFITGATGLDSEYALVGAHAGAAPSFTDCTHEATEIGATGLYYLDVSAAELNDDHAVIQVKSSSTGAITQVLEFNLVSAEMDAAFAALADDTDVAAAVVAALGTGSGLTALATAAALVTVSGLVDDLETRLTATRAGYLDRLDASVASRLAASSYTAPDNTNIGLAKTAAEAVNARLPADPADESLLETAIATRLATTGYTAPDNASITAIKAKTDNLPTDPADESLLEAAIATRLATASYTAPANADITAIKAKTDNLPAAPANEVTLALVEDILRNKLVTTDNGDGTKTVRVYNDAGNTVILTWTWTEATATRARGV